MEIVTCETKQSACEEVFILEQWLNCVSTLLLCWAIKPLMNNHTKSGKQVALHVCLLCSESFPPLVCFSQSFPGKVVVKRIQEKAEVHAECPMQRGVWSVSERLPCSLQEALPITWASESSFLWRNPASFRKNTPGEALLAHLWVCLPALCHVSQIPSSWDKNTFWSMFIWSCYQSLHHSPQPC